MNATNQANCRSVRGFTLIEILTVMAIIAVLAAILFPVFGAVSEQTRQSNTMSNMHAVYVGAHVFYEDEGQYPATLFPYAEVAITPANPAPCPANRPALPADITVSGASQTVGIPMASATGAFTEDSTACAQLNYGYLYGEQVKDYVSFLCPDNNTTEQQAVVMPYYPSTLPTGWPSPEVGNGTADSTGYIPVTWQATNTLDQYSSGDYDLPTEYTGASTTSPYIGQQKVYYKMDSMDVGPMLDPTTGEPVVVSGSPIYELHYTPDWTHELGSTADVSAPGSASSPNVTQLKYQNPPTDRTVLTYVTYHVSSGNSANVLVILASGSAIKLNWQTAVRELPLGYSP